jgi:site-specific DNA-adenine methylase
MFSYYGSKSNIVDYYPKPKHDKIIEPFAGSARYSLKYFDRDILLVDKYEVIIKIWQWLQQCSEGDIQRLPTPKPREDIRNYSFDCEEAQMLMRFIIGGGLSCPQWIVSPQGFGVGVITSKKRIINNLHKIKHWKIICGEYTELENETATWFIDPPYQQGGHEYIHGNKNIDYEKLSIWCKERRGQAIVCENTKSNWLPFLPMTKMRGSMFTTTEAIWSNEKTVYDNIQTVLF